MMVEAGKEARTNVTLLGQKRWWQDLRKWEKRGRAEEGYRNGERKSKL